MRFFSILQSHSRNIEIDSKMNILDQYFMDDEINQTCHIS